MGEMVMRRWEGRLTLAAIVTLSLVTVSCTYFPARCPYALLFFGLSPPTPLICVKAAYLYCRGIMIYNDGVTVVKRSVFSTYCFTRTWKTSTRSWKCYHPDSLVRTVSESTLLRSVSIRKKLSWRSYHSYAYFLGAMWPELRVADMQRIEGMHITPFRSSWH